MSLKVYSITEDMRHAPKLLRYFCAIRDIDATCCKAKSREMLPLPWWEGWRKARKVLVRVSVESLIMKRSGGGAK